MMDIKQAADRDQSLTFLFVGAALSLLHEYQQ